MSSYKIAVIGDRDCVTGFKALGLDTFAADSVDDAKAILHRLAKEDAGYAIIYITENFAEKMTAEIDKYKDSTVPAVILIPGKEGSLGLGLANLTQVVERAVGMDIL